MTTPFRSIITQFPHNCLFLCVAGALSACGPSLPIVGDLAIHPVEDQARPCTQIVQEMGTIEKQALALVEPKPNGEVIRRSATGFGTIIIWPVLETLVSAEDQDRLHELKYAHEDLEREAEAAECYGPRQDRERERDYDDGGY